MSSEGSCVETTGRQMSDASLRTIPRLHGTSWPDSSRDGRSSDEMPGWIDPDVSDSSHTDKATSWMD